MLELQLGESESGAKSRGGNSEQGVVGKSLPFAAAFAAGFLLGRRRAGGGDAGQKSHAGEGNTEQEGEKGDGQLSDVVQTIRSRAIPGRTEGASESGDGSDSGDESGSGDGSGSSDRSESSTDSGSMSGVQNEQTPEEQSQGEMPGQQFQGEASEQQGSEQAQGKPEGAQPAGTEAAGVDEAVAELSPPVAHGMPTFGLGTYRMEYDECVESVRQALQMGYRHVDTAEMYENETAVGDAIVEAEIGREDLFVATKISPENLAYDRVLTNAEESLDRLGMDSVDLLYVHWPTGEYEATDTLDAFAELREEGLIEEIGVSNFTVDLLEEAIEISEEPIFANQVEMHPLLPQAELRQFCAQDDVDVELVAYAPIARGDVFDVEELQEVADKHDATPAQVSLAWLREKDVTAIPKATSEDHLRENWLSLGLELDDEDVEKIDGIEERRRLVDPDDAPWNQ